MKKMVLGLLLIALLAGGSLACSGGDSRAEEPNATEGAAATTDGGESADGEEGEDAEAGPEAVPVTVTALEQGPMEAILRFSTNLEAERAVEVFAEATRQVRELKVEEGDHVRKGDVLIRLQDDEQKTAVAKVEAQLDKARREHERQQRLFRDSLISEQAFNDAAYELERLELDLEQAQQALSYTFVRAPISGTISSRLVNVGDYVAVNQHLFDIVDFGSIVARVFVPERELPRLEPGLGARVTSPALGERVYPGTVDRIAPVVDPRSGTVKVTVALPERPGLKPGMYVNVELVTAVHQDALLVPKRALVYDHDQIFVFRLQGEEGSHTVERLLVEPVLQDADFVEPGEGLTPGDRIVIAGQAGLKDGTRVRLARLDAPAPAAEEAAAEVAPEATEPAATVEDEE